MVDKVLIELMLPLCLLSFLSFRRSQIRQQSAYRIVLQSSFFTFQLAYVGQRLCDNLFISLGQLFFAETPDQAQHQDMNYKHEDALRQRA